ncbi:MAG: metalloregulator ArsR/SmtB family transcription factor [Devosia sp.]
MSRMNITEIEPRADDAAELLAAMANPKRLLILCHLLDQELSVGELSERVGLAQSPLSQHLSKLRMLRLVATRRDGQMILYRLASEEVGKILTTLYGIYCAPQKAAGKAKGKAPARA